MLLPPSIEAILDTLQKATKDQTLLLHLHVCRSGLEIHELVGNCLVSAFLEIGNIGSARAVFDRLVSKSESSWNSLIIGYTKCGVPSNALALFQTMAEEDVLLVNEFAYVALLKACANLEDLQKGCVLHSQIARKGLLERNLIIGTALVDLYAKCGMPTMAQEVFDKLQRPNVVSWTALIAGYAQHDRGNEALRCYELMKQQGVTPNATTFSSVLKACGSIGDEDRGSSIHEDVVKMGMLGDNQIVGNALIDMYAKCGSLAKAQEVFNILPARDRVSWTALISGYAQHEHGEEALMYLDRMQVRGISPDVVTFVAGLQACGTVGVLDKAKELHHEITKRGLLETNAVLGAALVDVYAKCGLLLDTQGVFDKLQNRSVDSWNALISGYAKHERGEEAVIYYSYMRLEGYFPDATTFVCILHACAMISALEKGREVHAEINQVGLLKANQFVGNALVDMYAKCGMLAKAQDLFDTMHHTDMVAWNGLIKGYAILGDITSVLRVFDEMRREDIGPDSVTFIGLFYACCHAGLVHKGIILFESMVRDFGISPTPEHITCMVDLLGRAGQLHKAANLFQKMSSSDGAPALNLLGACLKWGDVELGRLVFEYAIQRDEKDVAAYNYMISIYTNAGMHADAKVLAMKIQKLAQKSGEVFTPKFLCQLG